MKNTFLTLSGVVVMAVVPGLLANPYKDPTRVVAGKTVDLTPLFEWAKGRRESRDRSSAKERPLKHWVRVQGSVVKASGLGWEVEGSFDGPDGKTQRGRFFLKNPPKEEQAEHARLQVQLQEMRQQFEAEQQERRELQGQGGGAGPDLRGISEPPPWARPEGDRRSSGPGDSQMRYEYGQRMRGLVQTNVADSPNELSAAAALRLRYRETQAKLGDISDREGRYEVDVIAMQTGTRFNGLPVFDRGFVIKR